MNWDSERMILDDNINSIGAMTELTIWRKFVAFNSISFETINTNYGESFDIFCLLFTCWTQFAVFTPLFLFCMFLSLERKCSNCHVKRTPQQTPIHLHEIASKIATCRCSASGHKMRCLLWVRSMMFRRSCHLYHYSLCFAAPQLMSQILFAGFSLEHLKDEIWLFFCGKAHY